MTRVTFIHSLTARQLAVTSGMNTASGDCVGTGGSSESSVSSTTRVFQEFLSLQESTWQSLPHLHHLSGYFLEPSLFNSVKDGIFSLSDWRRA